MLKHNLLLFLRNFRRDKNSFLINLLGLSTGLACVLFIYLWVKDETSIDKYHQHDKYLYQVMAHHNNNDGITTIGSTPGLLADELIKTFPEVEDIARTTDWVAPNTLLVDNKIVKCTGKYADNSYFKLFSYEIISGDINHLLTDKNSMLISESLAKNFLVKLITSLANQ